MVLPPTMEFFLQVLALLIAAVTFLPLIRSDIWIIRGWDFPQLQLFVSGIITAAILSATGVDSFLWKGAVLLFLGAALVWQAVVIFPYTRLAKLRVQPGDGEVQLKVMVSNVLMSNRQSGLLLKLLREYQPDVFVALETDAWWVEQLSAVSEELPYAVELPQDDTYGMLVRSRLPLIEPVVAYLVRTGIPSVHGRFALDNGAEIHFHAVHPKPPFPDEDTHSTERDAELMIVGKQVKAHGGVSIVLGDMNDVAWSHTTRLFQRISGLLDPRMGRGFFNTFHAWHWWMRWPLDHMFVSPEFRVRRMFRLTSIGSDHFPIFAEFSYEPGSVKGDEAPEADANDRNEAADKIQEVSSS